MPIVNDSVLLPVDYSREIIKGIEGKSKAIQLGKRLADMTTKQRKVPVASLLPLAYWVANMTTPAGAAKEIKNKPISEAAWEGVTLDAEEIAVIIPISKNTLRDCENIIDLVPQLTNEAVGAFQKVIDESIFFGVNAPWAGFTGLVAEATAAEQTVTWNGTGGKSFYQAISDAMEKVEKAGFLPNAILGGPSLNSAFRGTITDLGVVAGDQGEVGALPRHVDLTGGFNQNSAFAIVGDFNYLVYAFREDMEMTLLTEATLVDPSTGNAKYHLAQQDMVALRFTMRLAAALPVPVNYVSGAASGDHIKRNAKAYPFAVITKSASGSN